MKLIKYCINCKKQFTIQQYRLKEKPNRGRFCCRKCVDEYKVKNRIVKNEKNPAWKGENVSYSGIHRWLRNNFKKFGVCEFCGKIGDTDWSVIGKFYTRNRNDYFELCRKCHCVFDGGKVIIDI